MKRFYMAWWLISVSIKSVWVVLFWPWYFAKIFKGDADRFLGLFHIALLGALQGAIIGSVFAFTVPWASMGRTVVFATLVGLFAAFVLYGLSVLDPFGRAAEYADERIVREARKEEAGGLTMVEEEE